MFVKKNLQGQKFFFTIVARGRGYLMLESVVFVVVFVIVLRYIYNKYAARVPVVTTGLCDNPSCLRCRSESRFERDVLLRKLHQYSKNHVVSKDLEDTAKEVIGSLSRQEDILRETLSLSGYDGKMEPVVMWMVPRLTRQPFWSKTNHAMNLNEVEEILQDKNTVEALTREYISIKEDGDLWSINQTPIGRWKVLPLVNQGVLINKNCSQCPAALEIIKKVKRFMIGNAFCYAMYSSLEAGSIIEPHTGPCNFRIRCHVPLTTPKGFRLQVGRDYTEWKKGTVVMFDDSLVHSVVCDRSSWDSRVVFIMDVWHPGVNQEMQKALNSIFAS